MSVGGSPGTAGVPGDFSGDGLVDATDIDQLYDEVYASKNSARFDLTGDGQVNQDDVNELVLNILGTRFGDTDLDGDVDAIDLNRLAVNWRRTDATSWEQADFNGDGKVDSNDLNEITANWEAVAEPAALPNRMAARRPQASLVNDVERRATIQPTEHAADELFAGLGVDVQRADARWVNHRLRLVSHRR